MTMAPAVSGSQGQPAEPTPKTIAVTGVTATKKQIAQAITILQKNQSTQVEPPLSHNHNPLSKTDFHGIAKAYYCFYPKLPKGTPKHHTAHVQKAFISYLELQRENFDQPDWTREENILAMAHYDSAVGVLTGKPRPGQSSAMIVQLSDLLKKLSAYPPEHQDSSYRDPKNVCLNLMHLRMIQANGADNADKYSRPAAAVWQEYIDDLPRLRDEADAIRALLQEGVLQPAQTMLVVEDTDIEQQHTESFMVNPSGKMRTAERAENKLVARYRDYMAAKGIVVNRKKYKPPGEICPMFSDAWVQDRQALIEAKNSHSRQALRMAIGQLYDYRRCHQPPPDHLAVLLPGPPSDDGLALLRSANIHAIWPHGPEFRDSSDGAFT